MQKILISTFQCAFILCLVFMTSCGSSVDVLDETGCEESVINSKSEAFVEAATIYVQDPSQVNCEAYKNATQEYLDAIDKCDGLYEAEVQNAKDSIAALDC